jgi:glycosyltransferase involved in cell wall biosynthesis
VELQPKPARILMITPRYRPYVGGIELHVEEVARRLVSLGLEVTILTTDPSKRLPTVEHHAGVVVRRVAAWPAGRDYYFAPHIDREIRKGTWDIVHLQGFQTLVAPLAMLSARRARLPYVVTFHAGGHSSRFRNAVRPLQLAALRPLLAGAARLVALAPFEVEQYARRMRLSRARFVVIPNGSDLPDPPDLTVVRDDSLVASIGRLERYKGHQRVLAAMPYVARQRPDVRLWIAGAGPYEPQLRQLAEELGVASRIEIRAVPPQDRARMASELSRVKVAVSLSEFETQPIAALEALGRGCRLVVADTPGLSTLAERGLARAVPLESDPGHVASVLLEELDLPAPAEPPTLPTWDDCAQALFDLYERVVCEQRGSR